MRTLNSTSERKTLLRPSADPGSYRHHPARTLPQQIADRIGTAIATGEYEGGEHIPEQTLAKLFGVSHGPVREALRELEKRGLVEYRPRRGAFAIEITLDTIADMFNIRAVLLGLSAHNLAARSELKELHAELTERAAGLKVEAVARNVDPREFALAVGRFSRQMWLNCGNSQLIKNIHEQDRGSLWGVIWREQQLDFFTVERRKIAASNWFDAARAVQTGNGAKADRILRKELFNSRDCALDTLRKKRGQKVNILKLIRD